MDYIAILFILFGIAIITVFIVYYSHVSLYISKYILPFVSSKNEEIDAFDDLNVNTLDEPSMISEVLKIP